MPVIGPAWRNTNRSAPPAVANTRTSGRTVAGATATRAPSGLSATDPPSAASGTRTSAAPVAVSHTVTCGGPSVRPGVAPSSIAIRPPSRDTATPSIRRPGSSAARGRPVVRSHTNTGSGAGGAFRTAVTSAFPSVEKAWWRGAAVCPTRANRSFPVA